MKIFRDRQRAELGPASSARKRPTQARRLPGCCLGGRPPAPQPPGEAPAGVGLEQARPGAPEPEGGCELWVEVPRFGRCQSPGRVDLRSPVRAWGQGSWELSVFRHERYSWRPELPCPHATKTMAKPSTDMKLKAQDGRFCGFCP